MTETPPTVELVLPATSGVLQSIGNCSGRWGQPNHLLFQLAHAAMFVAFLSPSTVHGVAMLHATLVLAFLMMSGWAWAVICAPDIFSWNFSFMVINSVQMLFVLYQVRPVKFTAELEDVYKSIFQPLRVPREMFKKLVAPDMCSVLSLHMGEAYAREEITRADRLGLLITGSARVLLHGHVLHYVKDKQFLDSPEFESTSHYDERFHVTIVAETACRYVHWQRHSLEYVFAREPYLGTIMGTIIGRDITNKLYTLNEKVRITHGARFDIRLPSISPAIVGSKSAVAAAAAAAAAASSNIRTERDTAAKMAASFAAAAAAAAAVAAESAFEVADEGEEGAYCSLLQHDTSRHHHYDTSPYHTCGGDNGEEQMVTCVLL